MSQSPYQRIRLHPNIQHERKKRQRELWLALVGIVLIGVLSWVELKFFGVNSYLFLGLFNVNLILLLLVLFLVVRNVVKLALERKRNVLGAKLRTRLVVIFFSLSIIPTLLMFFLSIKFVQTSVDYWFKAQVEGSMEQALTVGQAVYNTVKDRLEGKGEGIIETIRASQFVWGGKGMDRFLISRSKDLDLTLIGVLTPSRREQNWHAEPEWESSWRDVKKGIAWAELQERQRFWSAVWPGKDADLVVGIVPVDKGATGYLVLGATLPQGLLFKLDQIVRGVNEYKQLRTLKYPLKVALYFILGIMTMMIILGATWFGFRLAKEISAPIQALAIGTKRIARGDLGVRIDDESGDELGLLVQSFNKMAMDLENSQIGLKQAKERLERQNAELESKSRYMEAVLDNITAGVISLDGQGRINTFNKAAETILGIEASSIMGSSPMKLLQGEFARMVQEVLTQLQEMPSSQWQRQIDLNVGDMDIRLLVNAVVLHREGDEDSGIVAVFEDITELEKIQRMEAWKEVARRIAHEIKNPLTPIKLSAQRIESKFGSKISDPILTQCTRLIVRQVEHLQEMVKDFSSFAKLPELKLRYGDIVEVLEEIVGIFEQSHGRISWDLHVAPPLPELKFDREAMKRVFMNILLNAAEILGDDENGRVAMKVGYVEALHRVRIQIADNGPGLSSEERSRIFEPYFSSKRGGTGLGLTIVKSVIDDHHGYIRVHPNSPKGTTFVIELPAGKEQARWSRPV
ncbi:sensor histidine kinase NtrY-like [Desulfoplanes formicivorans]|uniref:histidine kinase n=1 Tax=Desulfoplanes formicivorans TaxID=1592317 RepID=A0A194AKM3_9BACT|nr:ATP-binding protein [Desulfoplanes formicivorans]GAU09790.1 PAS domain-containing sensor histidine kinase [Desulfoplanes formicivorans]